MTSPPGMSFRWLIDKRRLCIAPAGLIACRAASHRINDTLEFQPDTKLWEAACRQWLCIAPAGLIACRAASHRINDTLEFQPDTKLWEAACRRWLWNRRSRATSHTSGVSPDAYSDSLLDQRPISVLDGSCSSSSFFAVSAPATGRPVGSSRPICTSTLAWSQ